MKHSMIRRLQKKEFNGYNSFDPRVTSEKTIMKNGCAYHKEIAYGTQFPNSFMDIYCQQDAKERECDTLFYIHGGGYTWGDKCEGDGNAKDTDRDWFFQEFMKAGYNIVAINYALAPEYSYPTPVIQISEAVTFLKEHGSEYGIRTDRLIFGGGSAGCQLAGQFINIQTNPEYAAEMKMKPVLEKADIKAVLFNSALLDVERFGKTGHKVIDFLFLRCGRAYYDCKKLEGNPLVIQSGVTQHVTAEFPPTFISDGNTATFTDQNQSLAQKLEKLNVKYVLNIYPVEEVVLNHDFEKKGDQYGRDNLQKMLLFLENVLNKSADLKK